VRVLYHHRTLKTDAQGIHVDRLIAALRRRGNEVVEFSLVGGRSGGAAERRGAWAAVLKIAKSGPFREVMEIAYNAFLYPRLRRRVADVRPDLLYERHGLHLHAGGWAARRAGVPFVIEVNAPLASERLVTEGLAFRRLAEASERRALLRADRVVAVTSALKEILVAEGVDARKIVVMPNGADLREFDAASEEDVAAFRAEHALQGAVVGFVGFVRPWHGVDMLFKALDSPELLEEAPFTAVVVGDGPAIEALRVRAAKGALAGRVRFTGAIAPERIPAAIKALDVAAQPAATPYACPIKLVEYMAAGRAIVAPDQDNVVEVLGREAGLLFRPMDALDLRSAIRRLLLEPERRASLGRAARRRVEELDLTWDGNARRVEDLARSIRLEPEAAP